MKGLFNPTDTVSRQFKNGMMGTGVLGFDEINMSQSIKQFTTGTRGATGNTTSAAVTSEGATSIALTVGSGINNGDTIAIVGAGAAGATLTTTVSAGGGTTTLTLAAAASTTVSGAAVTTPGTWVSEGNL